MNLGGADDAIGGSGSPELLSPFSGIRLLVRPNDRGGALGACERTIRSYLTTGPQDGGLACCRDVRPGGACFAPSVADPERGAVLGPACTPVVEAGGADVGVAEPVLDASDVGVVLEGVRGGGGP